MQQLGEFSEKKTNIIKEPDDIAKYSALLRLFMLKRSADGIVSVCQLKYYCEV